MSWGRFFRHNTMMNRRLVEACRSLPPERLAAAATGIFGSIDATLVRIANAQEGYAARLLDTERPEAWFRHEAVSLIIGYRSAS